MPTQEEVLADMQSVYVQLLDTQYSALYFELKKYKVRFVTEVLVKTLASIVTLRKFGFEIFSPSLLRHITGMEVMMQLHKLGNFKIITVTRSRHGKSYRFMVNRQCPVWERFGDGGE